MPAVIFIYFIIFPVRTYQLDTIFENYDKKQIIKHLFFLYLSKIKYIYVFYIIKLLLLINIIFIFYLLKINHFTNSNSF